MDKPLDNPQTSADTAAGPAGRRELGISRVIYAAGYSFRDAAIWFVSITVGLIGFLTLGTRLKDSKKQFLGKASIEKASQFILDAPHGLGTLIMKGIIKVFGEQHTVVKAIAAIGKIVNGQIVATSIGLGWVLSHIGMAPGATKGWNEAQKAVDNYNALAAENEHLKKALAQAAPARPQEKAAEKPAMLHTERLRDAAPAQVGLN